MTFENVLQFVNRKSLSREQLQEMYSALSRNQRIQSARKVGSYSVGDRVKFAGRRGEVLTGRITKLNHTTVSIRAAGVNWTVSPVFIKK